VLRYLQDRPTGSEQALLEAVAQDGLAAHPELTGKVVSKRMSRLLHKLGRTEFARPGLYLTSLVLWSTTGLGWKHEDEAIVSDWLSTRAGVEFSEQSQPKEPPRSTRAVEATAVLDIRAETLRLLAIGSDIAAIATHHRWSPEETKSYLGRHITHGRCSLAQSVFLAIKHEGLTPPDHVQGQLERIQQQTLNASEGKVLYALALTSNPLVASERAGVLPRFVALHLSRLQAKLGVSTPAGLVGVAAWAGLLNDKPATNSVGMP
jgi:hypothetical protein